MGKNINTYKLKKIKSKTMKSNKKNKKLLKKMNTNDSILEENIQILIGGGNNNFIEPSELDKKIFGYEGPVDTKGPIGKLIDSVEDSIKNVEEVAENVISVGKVAVLKKLSDVAGYEGKTSDEVIDEIKNDAESIKQFNNYLKTENGKETLEDIQDLSNTATGIITKSIDKIPETLTDSMEKMGDAGLKVGVGIANEVPIIAPIIGLSNMIKGTEEAIEASADAVKKVAEITGDTAEEIKKPINEIENKIDEISNKIENTQKISQIPTDKSQMNETLMNETLMNNKLLLNEKNIQHGGSDMTKFHNVLQNGGKKLRKRINNTRYAFKNVSKNITKKNK